MQAYFSPGLFLRAFGSLRVPHKLGLGERLWGGSLGRRGTTWVDFGTLRWKLNLANDTHRWLVYGEYEEPALRRLLERVIDARSAVIDSGANIGQMILMYLRCGAPASIHAFEPTPAARNWLMECIEANQLRHIAISPLALGETPGWATLIENDFNQKEGAQNRIEASDTGLSIEVTTLDTYAAAQGVDRVRFWKLDTEGHELPALLGARLLLQREAIDYLYVETAEAGEAIFEELTRSRYVATTLSLDRVLDVKEVRANFTNVFASPGIAREECGFTMPPG